MNGNYVSLDISSYFTAAVMATAVPGVTKFSFILSTVGSIGRPVFLSNLATDPAGNLLGAPFVTFQPPASAATISTTMALSGTTAMTAANQAAMKAAVAATMPGVPASDVTLTVVGAQVTASVTLSAAQAAAFTPAAQAAYAAGLAGDMGVSASMVSVKASPGAAGGRRMLQAGSLELPITVTGFAAANVSAGGAMSPAAIAAATALSTALVSPYSNASASLASSGVPPGDLTVTEPPAPWHHLSFGVPVNGAAGPMPAPSVPTAPPTYSLAALPSAPNTMFPPLPPMPPPTPPATGAIVPTWLATSRRRLSSTSDPAAAATLLATNANSGALAGEMANQGVSPPVDTATAGRFARVSPANRGNGLFEGLRGARHGNAVVISTAPPAPGTIVVELQGIGANSASIQLLIIVAVVALFVSGVAVCAAAAALMRTHGGGSSTSPPPAEEEAAPLVGEKAAPEQVYAADPGRERKERRRRPRLEE